MYMNKRQRQAVKDATLSLKVATRRYHTLGEQLEHNEDMRYAEFALYAMMGDSDWWSMLQDATQWSEAAQRWVYVIQSRGFKVAQEEV